MSNRERVRDSDSTRARVRDSESATGRDRARVRDRKSRNKGFVIFFASLAAILSVGYVSAILLSPFLFGYVAYEIAVSLQLSELAKWCSAIAVWGIATLSITQVMKNR